MRIHRTILAATLALACGPALADGHQHGSDAAKHGDMKARCEMMHDGKMTPEEHRKHADENGQERDREWPMAVHRCHRYDGSPRPRRCQDRIGSAL